MLSFPFLSNIIRGLQNQSNLSQSVTLTPGQIVSGEILKLFPDQSALVQLGKIQVHAKLETPLNVDQKAWFQVQENRNPVTLKIVSTVQQPTLSSRIQEPNDQYFPLLSLFGLKKTESNMEILRFFVDEKLPMAKEGIQMLSRLVSESKSSAEPLLRAAQSTIFRGLPLTPEIVQSIRSYLFDPPVHQQLKEFLPMLSKPELHTTQRELEIQLNRLVIQEISPPSIKLALQQLGLEQEKILKQSIRQTLHGPPEPLPLEQQQLKTVLQRLVMDPALPSAIKEKAKGMIQHITGQQIFLQSDVNPQSPFYQVLFQLPIEFSQQTQYLYGQLEGKKKTMGRLTLTTVDCCFIYNSNPWGKRLLMYRLSIGLFLLLSIMPLH